MSTTKCWLRKFKTQQVFKLYSLTGAKGFKSLVNIKLSFGHTLVEKKYNNYLYNIFNYSNYVSSSKLTGVSTMNKNDDSDEKSDLSSVLIKWGMCHNISHIAFSKLLKILGEYGFKNLPKNSRDLLKARENEIKVTDMPPGVYVHYGIEKNLIKSVSLLIEKNLVVSNHIGISVFIDNLPLSKVSTQGIWAILCSINGFNETIFLIGAYLGDSRPQDSNMFLNEFVIEAKNLCKIGLKVNEQQFLVKFEKLICDAPAKAFILNFKSSLGYSSCTKCDAVGEYNGNKICFPTKGNLRTDKDFNCIDLYKDKKTQLLEISDFGVVSNIPLEFLHVVCLGVVRKLILIWVTSDKQYFQSKKILGIVKNIQNVQPYEFHRKQKPLNMFEFWTPDQFRQFLLYFGPFLLKDVLSQRCYDHFLLLHVACRIFCFSNQKIEIINFAETLLNKFIEEYMDLYGRENVTNNIHGLYHLADDYRLHGTLDSFSALPYEKFLIQLRNSMRTSKKRSLPQTILKYSHDSIFGKNLRKLEEGNLRVEKRMKKTNEKSFDSFDYNYEYKKLHINNSVIIPEESENNNILLPDGNIVKVSNIFEKVENSSKKYFIAGRKFLNVSNFYREPLESSVVNIFRVEGLSENLQLWPVDKTCRKCVFIPYADNKQYIVGMLDE